MGNFLWWSTVTMSPFSSVVVWRYGASNVGCTDVDTERKMEEEKKKEEGGREGKREWKGEGQG